jgi:hypothetical protein
MSFQILFARVLFDNIFSEICGIRTLVNRNSSDIISAKVGIRNFSPQFRNIAAYQIDYGLRTKKSCGTAIADL